MTVTSTIPCIFLFCVLVCKCFFWKISTTQIIENGTRIGYRDCRRTQHVEWESHETRRSRTSTSPDNIAASSIFGFVADDAVTFLSHTKSASGSRRRFYRDHLWSMQCVQGSQRIVPVLRNDKLQFFFAEMDQALKILKLHYHR